MKAGKRLGSSLFALGLWLAAAVYPVWARATYVLTTVDVPGLTGFVSLLGINDFGQVVGNISVGNDPFNVISFVYQAGTFTPLPPPPAGMINLGAAGINNAGTIVGGMSPAGAIGSDGGVQSEQGFILSGGTYRFFSHPGYDTTEARGIGPTGMIVGVAVRTSTPTQPAMITGFIYDPLTGAFTDILPLTNNGSRASGINAAGQVVGATSSPGQTLSYLRQPDGTLLPFQIDSLRTEARGINNYGAVTGYALTAPPGNITLPFVGTASAYELLNVPTGYGFGLGINNLGQVVGEYFDFSTDGTVNIVSASHGFIATPDTCLVPSGQTFDAAGGFGSFGVNAGANCGGNATSTDSWISLLPGVYVCVRHGDVLICPPPPVSGSVNFTVASNNSAASRTGHILVGGNSFTVTQAGVDPVCTYSVTPASQHMSAGGGTASEAVVSSNPSCGWTATVDAGSAGAMRVTAAVGRGNGLVALAVTPNNATTSRTLTATVAGRSITVLQSGSVPTTRCGASDVSGSVMERFSFTRGPPATFGYASDSETVYITNTTGSTLTNLYYVLHDLPFTDLQGGYYVSGWTVNGSTTTGASTTCFGRSETMVPLGNIAPGQTITLNVSFQSNNGFRRSGITSTTLLSGRPNQ